MKQLYIVILLLLCNASFAQNWALVNDTTNYFFDYDIGNLQSAIIGFKIDTVYSNGGNVNHTPNKTLGPITSGPSVSFDSLFDNQFGANYLSQNTTSKIVTKNLDTLLFSNICSSINEWELMRISTSESFYGVKIDADTFRFKGVLDSMITFYIKHVDSNSNITSSSLNDTLAISKNNGWIKTYDWLNFPDSNISVFNRSEMHLMTNEEVYDFNIGDEFHSITQYSNGPPSYHNITILNRIDSVNSITYERQHHYKFQSVDYSTNPPTLNTNFFSNRDTLLIAHLDSLIGTMPNEITHLEEMMIAHVPLYSIPSRLNYSTNKKPYYYPSLNAYSYFNVTPIFEYTYIEGCGKYITSNNQTQWSYEDERLVYFKKGNETWGKPNILTGIENNPRAKTFEFYPNPSSNYITLINTTNDREAFIQIRDINGKVVKTVKAYQEKQIDISDLADGVYLLELNSNSEIVTSKLIVNH